MTMKAHRFVGLDRDVWLPDDINVIIDIVPDRFIGWVRSGVGNAPNYSTWHDTGAPGQSAWSQRNYLHNGPRNPDGSRRQVGFNFAVDDHRLIQLTPLNETTWAAGTAVGNRTSFHVEQCFGGTIDWDQSLRNAAAVHGGLIAAMPGWVLVPSLVQHHKWYGKDCPRQIRRRGLWPQAVRMAQGFFDQARAAAQGQPEPMPTPAPEYADPDPIPELAGAPTYVKLDNGAQLIQVPNMTVRAVRDTPRLRWATPQSASIGEDVRKGQTFDVDYLIVNPDGSLYWYTPWHTRFAFADVVPIERDVDIAA